MLNRIHSSLARASVRHSAAVLLGAALLASACNDSTGPNGGSCTASQTINVGTPVNGSLSTGDCFNDEDAYEDKWILTLAATTQVQIDLMSGAFDTFLWVLDSDGDEIDANDDIDQTDTDSRLTLSLGAGTYTLVATSFFANRTGAYQMSVVVVP